MEDALRHVDGMSANYGGTEIATAIEGAAVLRKLEAGRPTSIFVLTDGEAWDLDSVSAEVQKHVQAANAAESPIKFFCMGIGNSPSKVRAYNDSLHSGSYVIDVGSCRCYCKSRQRCVSICSRG